MKKVCYASQMRNIDKNASEEGGIPSIVLMENAAFSCVVALTERFGGLDKKHIAVFCGKGNNGGDGFAIARHLYNIGVDVDVFLVCGDEFKGDAQINYDIIEKAGVHIEYMYNSDFLELRLPSYDIVIDAIYGTGIHGELKGLGAEVIEKINQNSRFIMAVDVPSGMNSDTGEICGICVRADMTVTFAAYKAGMFLYPAADYTGEIILKDISIPQYIINSSVTAASVLDVGTAAERLPRRTDNSQKGDYGKVLIIGGSRGMSGAVFMAGNAALNAGAGLVRLAVPEFISDILEVKTTEVMTLALSDIDGHISRSGAEELAAAAEWADSVLIGPGLGTSGDCAHVLRELLKSSKVPMIIDADALNILARNMDMLEECTCPLILTPHEMEFSRLTGLSISEIQADRLGVSKRFSEKYGVTLILKGHHTIVTSPDGMQYINNTGNAGLAKGGSGDVLAGITAALAAREIDETDAAALAVYIHGKSADAVMEQHGTEAVTATAVIASIGKTTDIICRKTT